MKEATNIIPISPMCTPHSTMKLSKYRSINM